MNKSSNTPRVANCYRCGKKHLSLIIELELDSITNRFHYPEAFPLTGMSQGFFRFGVTCATRQLKEQS